MIACFIRHSAPAKSHNSSNRDWGIIPNLSPEDLQLSERLKHVDFDIICCSQMRRSVETAFRLLGDKRVTQDERLNELGRGPFIEDYFAQVRATFDAPFKSVDGWEAASACRLRIISLLRELHMSGHECVALFGHGLQGALLRSYCLRREQANADAWRAIKMPDVMILRVLPNLDFDLVEDFGGVSSNM